MARGKPALWSTLLCLPFISGGAYLYFIQQRGLQLPGLVIPRSSLNLFGIPLVVFGMFIFLIGLYIQLVSPESPSLRDGEEIVDTRRPSQRVAVSKIVVGLPLLGAAGYLLFFTLVPYVYPTATLLGGLYFFSSGLKTYWANTLTTYHVTTDRVISEYRFISLRRQELPMNKLRGVEERKSIMEALVGLGNIRVASGGGGGSVQLIMRNIGDSSDFAEELRALMT